MLGVCIAYFHENYGGMLQAFATVTTLEKKNIQYELIRYEKDKNVISIIKSLPRLVNGILLNDKKEAFKKKIGKRRHPDFARNDAIRMEAFMKFKKEHFTKLSIIYKGYPSLRKGAKKYTAVMTGSDQLWSPAGLPTNFYNLMFVSDNIRKISYASSFGVKNIPWYQIGRTRDYLERIEFISMRENRGAEIVKEISGKNVPVVLDPVFMLSKEEWEKAIPVKQEYKEPYIFAYFLGTNPEYRIAVQKAAKELNCKIVTLRHLDQYVENDERFGDYAPYDVGPDRFLNILRGAKYICTDSFHGSCFSIIHEKKFVIFNRYDENSSHSKNSRIDSLCENLEIEHRRYVNENNLSKQLLECIVYKKINEKLEVMKEEANHYLNEALKGI